MKVEKNKRFKKIYIEISNICNLQCSFCPVVERDKKIMSFEHFQKIYHQVAPYTEEICLHLMGEPLAHPEFLSIWSFVNEQFLQTGIKINLTTNGILLKKYAAEHFNPIKGKALKQINFSLHSFFDNFPHKDINPYLEPILQFAQQMLEENPDLYINYRLWDLPTPQETLHTSQDILKMIADFFHQPQLPERIQQELNATWKKSFKIKGRLYLHFETQFEWPSLKKAQTDRYGFCYGLTSHLGIHADGSVVPCCLDKEAVINLGNCHTQTFPQILQGDRAVKIKKGFEQFLLQEELCQKCTYRQRFDGKIPLAIKKKNS